MKDITAELSYLSKRPFWAMLQAELDTMYTRVMLNLQGIPQAQGPKWKARAEVMKAVAERFVALANGGQCAVIQIVGPLDSASSDIEWYGGTSYEYIQAAIEQAVTDPQVSEIILLVDSPGGAVIGLPETADAIYKATQEKPVTAIVTGMAASAAYHLTSQANQIVMTPSGEVGSVGVIMLHADFSKQLMDAGINVTAISAGKYKTEFWPYFPLTEAAKAAAQVQIDDIYETFLSNIRRGRGSRATASGLEFNFGNGRMLLANEAIAAGMIDRVQTVREAFKAKTDRNRAYAMARNRSLELMGE